MHSGQIVEILECGKLPASQAGEVTGQIGFQQIAEQMPIILWTTDRDLANHFLLRRRTAGFQTAARTNS